MTRQRVALPSTLAAACLVAACAVVAAAEETPWIYGIHDHDPAPWDYLNRLTSAGVRGWVSATVEIGNNPGDHNGGDFRSFSNAGHTVIVRLNNGYFPNGTIPVPAKYDDFAQRCANYVAATQGADIFIIGNETNIAVEWPVIGGRHAYVSPQDYASCFRKCYNTIKNVRADAKVLCQPLAPFAGPFGTGTMGDGLPHDGNPLGWTTYMNQMLTSISATGGIDGIAVHINSRGYTYADVHSTAKVNGQYWSFYVYKDWINLGTPAALRTLPYYATECNGVYYWKGGHPECVNCSDPRCCYQTDWIEWIYAEINDWNQAHAATGEGIIRCVNMYRWCSWCDGWNIDGSPQEGAILSDLQDAAALDYRWPGGGTPPEPDEYWQDDFEDGTIDTSFPEPAWAVDAANGLTVSETSGELRLTGVSGAGSYGGVRTQVDVDDFAFFAKLRFLSTGSTVGGESNAELRFRTSATGTGYSLSFKAADSPNVINLRRSDTWAVVQSRQATHPIANGDTFYIGIEADGAALAVRIGSAPGASDIVDWTLTDSTFASGRFRLFNYQARGIAWDDVFFGPPGYDPYPSDGNRIETY